jgi:hypothetical protein
MLRHQFTFRLEQEEEVSPVEHRIVAVLMALDAERLLSALNHERGPQGRDDYTNRVMWNCMIAFGCLCVRSVPDGLKFLKLSPGLRRICGIESRRGVPTKFSFYRFEKRLTGHLVLMEEIFAELVRRLKELLPGFGERLATDSTKLHSQANGRKPSVDGDASWKKYEHAHTDEKGQKRKSSVTWFGYKLHLIVDALYELPIAELVTTARDNDAPHFPALWQKAKDTLPGLAEIAKSNAQDKGYDEVAVYQASWKDGVEPVIPLKDQTEEENKVLLPENQQVCPRGDALRFDGYETARNALRYDLPKTCPRENGNPRGAAVDRGYCELSDTCAQKFMRVKVTEENLRHLGPVVRESKKFARLYRGRTAVERVNSRLKAHDGLDEIKRRGIMRVSVWALIALLCMNAFAVTVATEGRIKEVRKTVWTIAA